MLNIYRLFIVLISIGLLSACGFHLRGSSPIADRYNPLNVQQDQLSDQQWQQLKSALKNASVTLSQAEQANRLRVSFTRLKDSKISGASSSSVELIQLSMQLEFSLLDGSGNILIEPQLIQQSSTLELDTNNVLSHQESIQSALMEQQKSLIRSMIYRLQK